MTVPKSVSTIQRPDPDPYSTPFLLEINPFGETPDKRGKSIEGVDRYH